MIPLLLYSSKNKIAIILPKHPYKHEDYTFYDVICINRGWNVKLIKDKKTRLNGYPIKEWETNQSSRFLNRS